MRSATALLMSFAILSGVPAAYAANYGLLRIEVRDVEGSALPGAHVEITSSALLGAREAATGSEGEIVFPGLLPGSYRVRVTPSVGSAVERTAMVVQDRTTVVEIRVGLPQYAEKLTVVGETPVVDAHSATVSSHLALSEVQELPVPRDYRGYVQVVPGVSVVPNGGGLVVPREPSAKGGNNYGDRGAIPGSVDNTYYLDGLNVTGMASGVGDLPIDSQTIAEEEVITSAVPVDLSGGVGYVVNLLTKSGGPELKGSANYFAQTPGMVSSFKTHDSRLRPVVFDRYDTGLELGGPVVRDRLWFYLAGQQRVASRDVELSSAASPTPVSVPSREQRRGLFGKLTFQASPQDSLVARYTLDPHQLTGTTDVNTPPNRFSRFQDDVSILGLDYQRTASANAFLEGRLTDFKEPSSNVPEHPELGPANTILFPPGTTVPTYEQLLGSAGGKSTTTLRKLQADLNLTTFFTARGDHALKVGAQYERWQEEVKNQSPFGFTLTSLAPGLGGLDFAQAVDLNLLPQSEYDSIYRALIADPTTGAFRAADANHDGTVSAQEFAALPLASRAGNAGGVNFLRSKDLIVGVSNVEMRNRVGYLQDTWQLRRLSLQAGVRMESRSYIASDGSTILAMSPAWLPRFGLTWDVRGDGRQKLSLSYGEYANPLRTSMVRYAGNLTGSVSADQAWIGDDWFTYRIRGAQVLHRDAGFAPNLKNESEQETALTYAANLSSRWTLLAQGYYRRDLHIIEDYDPSVYFNPAVAGPLALTPGDFGYPPSGAGDVNYFLGNLVGAERKIYGLDLALDRRFAGRWSASLQYSWKQAKGNSNSQAAADLQGDFLQLDPRQPWMWGWLPGTIEHQVKLLGTYRTPFALEIGALAYWNSGARYTEADIWRPTGSDIYYNHRLADGTYVATGEKKNPSWTTLDLRLGYPFRFSHGVHANLALTVYNVFDSQKASRLEPGHNDVTFQYGEPRELLLPRRWEAGVRVGF